MSNIIRGVSRVMSRKFMLGAGVIAALAALPVVGLAIGGPGPSPKPVAVEQAAPKDDIDRVERYLEDIQSLSANFIQQAPDGSVTEGKLTLLRPGKLRFEYQPEVPLLVVSDGTTLTFVDYSIKQVTRWPISDTPLGVLVAKTIDLRGGKLQTTATRDPGGLLKVKVIDPKRKDQGFITLLFENQPLTLKAWEVTDPQGLQTRVTLLDAVYNTDVSGKSFTFKDPRNMPLNRKGGR
ncbi:LolA family protein [Govanella unica]|uniref:Outer-membrane lipoprotein carrier protein LolA n=1 Tax=Govanella unica TaxID=2975056 RepID=A0A9X3Z606_9PROT|nr:outer-membrane lipoprotein carrier protein LolA [Govania unica]MDA5192439.1 outer-membrane lipoprotein carrier protein LolA [Govania unica]